MADGIGFLFGTITGWLYGHETNSKPASILIVILAALPFVSVLGLAVFAWCIYIPGMSLLDKIKPKWAKTIDNWMRKDG